MMAGLFSGLRTEEKLPPETKVARSTLQLMENRLHSFGRSSRIGKTVENNHFFAETKTRLQTEKTPFATLIRKKIKA